MKTRVKFMKFMLDHWRDYNNKASFSMWYVVGFVMFLNSILLVASGYSMLAAYTGTGLFSELNSNRHWTEPILVKKWYAANYLTGKLAHATTSSILGGLLLIHVFKAYAFCDGDYRASVQRSGMIMYLCFVIACASGYAITSGTMSLNLMLVIQEFLTPMWFKTGNEEETGVPSIKPLASSVGESVDRAGQNQKVMLIHATFGVLFFAVAVWHMMLLHTAGNSKWKNTEANKGSVPFWSWAVIKDCVVVTGFWWFLLSAGMCASTSIGLTHVEHNIVPDTQGAEGRVLVPEVKPEWHLLSYFGALKCLTHKIAGELICATWIMLAFAIRNYRQPYATRTGSFWN